MTLMTITDNDLSACEEANPCGRSAFVMAEGCYRIFRIAPNLRPTMFRRPRTRLHSVMATSEKLLTGIAIRLAVLLVAGLLVKNAAADLPQRGIAWVTDRAVVHVQAPPAANLAADAILRDMLLHD